MPDIISLGLSFLYVSIILLIGEGLRRGLGFSVEFTRKFVHIGVGTVAFALVVLFHEWYFAVIPPALFVLINYLSYRRDLFQGMETGQSNQLGTVYFPISFVILIPLLWPKPALLVASLMPMTWGDAFAAILGRRFGRHRYAIFSHTRSVEGSLAMFVFSFVSVLVVLIIFSVPPVLALVMASGAAAVATAMEAISPWGIDNLTVPISSALVLVLINELLGT